MPFKTKRQKLAAAARRFTFSDSGLVSYSQKSSAYQVAEEVKVQPEKLREEKLAAVKTSGGEIENLSYVRADLVKILILASLVVGAQIALSLIRP